MRRLELVVLTVIALCLVKLAFGGGLVTDARAEPTPVSCEAFTQDPGGALSQEKILARSREWVAPVQAWLAEHPGSTAFATQLYNGYVYVICVRG